MSSQQIQGEEEEKEIEKQDELSEKQKEEEQQQPAHNAPQPNQKIRVCIWWLLWQIQCFEVLILQLAQTKQVSPDDLNYEEDDEHNICAMSVGLNLLRLMLIAVTLISYTPIKRCLNRLPFVSVFSEISMIMLSVISLLSYQQSAYISLIIPTLRITFQLCNITSALFNQQGSTIKQLILRGFINLQFFIFMNGFFQACPIFVAFLSFTFFFQITYEVLVALLAGYIIMFLSRSYLQYQFKILESGDDKISKYESDQQSDNFQSQSNKFWIISSQTKTSNNLITSKELFLSYFLCFLITFLNANGPGFSQNFTSSQRIYSELYLLLLLMVSVMVKLLTLEDTLNTIIILSLFFNSSYLFLLYYYEKSIFFQIFQTIISALSSCVPLLVVNYFDLPTNVLQFQQQHFASLAFFALSQFIQLMSFSFDGIGEKFSTIFSIVLNSVAIPMIYVLRWIRRRKMVNYQGLRQLDQDL